MNYLPIHFCSSSIWLRDDNLWTNLNQFCVNIMELIVYYTYMTVWTFLYLWIYSFLFLFPKPHCDIWAINHIIFYCDCSPWICRGYWNHRGYFHCTHGCYFYWILPRQFILHLYPYNILRFLWGTLNKE